MTISRIFAHTIYKALKKSDKADEAISPILLFLEKRGLLGYLQSIKKELRKLSKEKENTDTIIVHTPFEIDESLKQDIKKMYQASPHNPLKEIINRDHIGGIKTEYNYTFIDTTIKSKLNRLKKELLQN